MIYNVLAPKLMMRTGLINSKIQRDAVEVMVTLLEEAKEKEVS
jgi:hypothetical protein